MKYLLGERISRCLLLTVVTVAAVACGSSTAPVTAVVTPIAAVTCAPSPDCAIPGVVGSVTGTNGPPYPFSATSNAARTIPVGDTLLFFTSTGVLERPVNAQIISDNAGNSYSTIQSIPGTQGNINLSQFTSLSIAQNILHAITKTTAAFSVNYLVDGVYEGDGDWCSEEILDVGPGVVVGSAAAFDTNETPPGENNIQVTISVTEPSTIYAIFYNQSANAGAQIPTLGSISAANGAWSITDFWGGVLLVGQNVTNAGTYTIYANNDDVSPSSGDWFHRIAVAIQ